MARLALFWFISGCARGAADTGFHVDFRWWMAASQAPDTCAGLYRLRPQLQLQLDAVGVTVDSACQRHSAKISLSGPRQAGRDAISQTVRALSHGPLAAPSRWMPPRLWDSAPRAALLRTLPEDTALFGPQPPLTLANPAPSDAKLLDALRQLAETRPEVSFEGLEDDPSGFWAGAGANDTEPPRLVSTEPAVHVWTTGRRSVTALRVGQPYDPDQEDVYAVYEAWLASREAYPGLVGGASYPGAAVERRFERGRAGEPTVTRLRLPARWLDPRAMGPVIPAALWLIAAHEPGPHPENDNALPREVREALIGEPVAGVDFAAYLSAEAAAPLSFVITGHDPSDPDLHLLGHVIAHLD